MYRGTTPTFHFVLPIEAGTLTKLAITFDQPGGAHIEKTLHDCTMDEKSVSCSLTEEETLSLTSSLHPCRIQLRCGVGEARMASQIFRVVVGEILKDGAL